MSNKKSHFQVLEISNFRSANKRHSFHLEKCSILSNDHHFKLLVEIHNHLFASRKLTQNWKKKPTKIQVGYYTDSENFYEHLVHKYSLLTIQPGSWICKQIWHCRYSPDIFVNSQEYDKKNRRNSLDSSFKKVLIYLKQNKSHNMHSLETLIIKKKREKKARKISHKVKSIRKAN